MILFEVGDADLENVSVVMRPGFTMPGRIRVEAVENRSSFDVGTARVSLIRDPDLVGLPQPSNRIVAPGQLRSGVPSTDGTFTLSGFGAGDYRVECC